MDPEGSMGKRRHEKAPKAEALGAKGSGPGELIVRANQTILAALEKHRSGCSLHHDLGSLGKLILGDVHAPILGVDVVTRDQLVPLAELGTKSTTKVTTLHLTSESATGLSHLDLDTVWRPNEATNQLGGAMNVRGARKQALLGSLSGSLSLCLDLLHRENLFSVVP